MKNKCGILLIVTAVSTAGLTGCGKSETPEPTVIELSQPSTTETVETNLPSPASSPTEATGHVLIQLDIPSGAKAIVSIDGNEYAASELEQPIPLPVGEHTIALHLGGEEARTRRITVVQNKRQVVEIGEPNRQAARWALKMGGELRVQTNGKSVHVKQLEDLPDSTFQITHLQVHDAEFTDDDLSQLAPLTGLVRVSLDRSNVTDEAFRHFSGLSRLQELSLFICPQVNGSGFQYLKDLPLLRSMTLHNTRVNDAGLSYLKSRTSLEGLNLIDCPVTDAGLKHLAELSKLHYLDISGTQLTDSGLKFLEKLTHIRSLGLARTQISDAGLAQLRSLENLAGLGLERTQITGNGLTHLKHLAQMHHLNMNDTPLEDNGLAHLVEMPNLTELWIARTKITDQGLKKLSQSNRWTWLSLDGTTVTDTGVQQLKNFDKLHSLGLHSTQVTDAGIAHLKSLKSLRELGLSNTKVTEAGIADLKSALPNCNIHK